MMGSWEIVSFIVFFFFYNHSVPYSFKDWNCGIWQGFANYKGGSPMSANLVEPGGWLSFIKTDVMTSEVNIYIFSHYLKNENFL